MNIFLLAVLVLYWLIGAVFAVMCSFGLMLSLFLTHKDEAAEVHGTALGYAIASEVALSRVVRNFCVYFLVWPYFVYHLIVTYGPQSEEGE